MAITHYLGQGNIFTGMCQSFCSQGLWCHFLSGCLVPGSFQGCLCPRGLCHAGSVRGSLSRGLSGGLLSREMSVWGSLSGGLCQEDTPWTKTFLYGKERAVGILLDCFLVTFCDKFNRLFTPAIYHAITITINFKNGLWPIFIIAIANPIHPIQKKS